MGTVPGARKQAEIGAAHDTIAVEVELGRPPCGEEGAEIRAVDHAAEIRLVHHGRCAAMDWQAASPPLAGGLLRSPWLAVAARPRRHAQ